ncbi:MAG: FAD-dependent oxidoreductase [Eggerthellaceae bacterium]|nr:FAD-dependent oxidoreductase [Eggerthellaceae bacterium]
MQTDYDIIVIGAGVAGCCVARELARWDASIVVLEAGNDICSGATRANSGIIHAGFDPKPGSAKARYNKRGSELYPQWSNELGFPIINNGSLVVAYSEEELATVRDLVARGHENGIEGVRELSRDELFELEPNVSHEALGALLAPTGGICDPYHVALRAGENAAQNGVTFEFNARVASVEKEGDAFRVVLEQGSVLHARAIVNAAGVYADEINNMVSKRKLEITARRGDYCLLDTDYGPLFTHTMFQAPTANGKGVLVSPTIHGNLLIGPNAHAQDSKSSLATERSGLEEILEAAKKTWPDCSMRGVITNFAGLRATGNTGDFEIGEPDDAPGFFNIACFESPGLTSAPAVAEDLGVQIAAFLGAQPRADFNPHNKPKMLFAMMDDEAREAAIAANPAEGHLVCRCCTVSEADIVDVLHGPLPCLSLDALKWRCGAMMGRCHGGFCSPELMKIFVRETGLEPTQVDRRGANSPLVVEARSDYIDYVAAKKAEAPEGLAQSEIAGQNAIYDAVVVGGGAAGIAAANAAAQAGAKRVLLIDREAQLGGILKQCVHSGFGLHRFAEELTGPEYAARELGSLNDAVELLLNTSVLRIDAAAEAGGAHTVVASNKEGLREIAAKAVVLSTGSRERGSGSINIAGTRPAGVFSAGSAQNFMNLQGCLPGRRIVIQGTGDVGLIMARRLTLQGAEVLCVLGTSPWPAGLRRNIVQCLDDYDIPLLLSKTVVRLEGEKRLEAVWIADAELGTRAPIPGTEERIECDTLLLSIGLLPENEVAKTAGVEVSSATGGAIVDDTLATNVPGIFACGNALHVHDVVDFASAEGDRAGLAAAAYALGKGGTRAASSDIAVEAGNGVSYVVPQRILRASIEAGGEVTLFFRVRKPLEKPSFEIQGITAAGDTLELKRKKARIAVPAEMEQMTIKLDDLATIERISVHAEGVQSNG